MDSSIKIKKNDLNSIKFGKKFYPFYNKFFYQDGQITYEDFIFLILQLSIQTNFYGYLDELYYDLIKRRSLYIKELVKNFKESFIGKPLILHKLNKFFCYCGGPMGNDIYFNRKMLLFDFENLFNEIVEEKNSDKKANFIFMFTKFYNEKILYKILMNVNKKTIKGFKDREKTVVYNNNSVSKIHVEECVN